MGLSFPNAPIGNLFFQSGVDSQSAAGRRIKDCRNDNIMGIFGQTLNRGVFLKLFKIREK